MKRKPLALLVMIALLLAWVSPASVRGQTWVASSVNRIEDRDTAPLWLHLPAAEPTIDVAGEPVAVSAIAKNNLDEYELIVVYTGSQDHAKRRVLRKQYNLSVRDAIDLEEWPDLDVLTVADENAAQVLLQQLASEPGIEHIQPNYLYHPAGAMEHSADFPIELVLSDAGVPTPPNDPNFSLQWGLHNTGQSINGITGIAGIDTNAQNAWLETTGSSDIVVAVIDSGVQLNHPDLVANIWVNSGETPDNGIDDDNNGFVDDYYGWNFDKNQKNTLDTVPIHMHGTHVAGTIAAVQNNSIGISGVAPNVLIMGLNFMYLTSDGKAAGSTASAIQAIDYASRNGASLINASWGGTANDALLEQAIAESGIPFITAAGNSGNNIDTIPEYPAAYALNNLVSVAAINNSGALASFSNYGATRVALGAPGVSVYSTVLSGNYGYNNGTSMAAPHVSGVAALMLAVNPDLTASQVISYMTDTAVPLPSLHGKTVSGGMVNAAAAVNAAKMTDPAPTPRYQVVFRDWNGTVLNTQTVLHGESVVPPSNPSRTGYTFTGWDRPLSNVASNLAVTALYAINNYTVRFRDWNGTVLKTQSVPYQGSAAAPADPSRTGYRFTGWDRPFNNVTSELDVTAHYAINTYTVRFYDWNGTVLKTQSVPYQGSAAAPADPSRTGYRFTGWDKPFSNVTSDRIVTATYAAATLQIKSGSAVVFDSSGTYLRGMSAGMTVRQLQEQFSNAPGELRIVSAGGQIIPDASTKLATGMQVQLYNGNVLDQKSVVIPGDVNGDGQISALDLLQAKRHLLRQTSLQSVYGEAGKVTNSSTITALDLLQIKRHLLGQVEIR